MTRRPSQDAACLRSRVAARLADGQWGPIHDGDGRQHQVSLAAGHQGNEAVEEQLAGSRARCCLRVVLDGEG